MTDIAWRVARWHPVVLTMVILAGLVVQVSVASLTLPPIARGFLILTPLGPMCLWLWAVFRVARRASGTGSSGGWDLVFALPPVIALVSGLAGWSINNSPAAFAIFFSLFAGLSLSAKALEIGDAPNGNPSVGRVLGTALLMYLVPFGLWMLRPKILRAAARAAPAPV